MHIVHSTLYNVQYTNLVCKLHNYTLCIHDTFFLGMNPIFNTYIIDFIYILRYIMHSVHCTMYSLYNVYCILYVYYYIWAIPR